MNKMKEYRVELNKSQSEMAQELGITQRHVAFLETGDRRPSLDLAVRISQYFGKSIEDIFYPKTVLKVQID